jgi:hypothetical protein
VLNAPGPRRRPRLGTPSQSLTSASQDQLPPFEFSSIHPGSPTYPDPPTTATCLSEDAGDVQGRGASHQHVLIGDVKLSDTSRDRRLGKSLGAQAHAHHTYQNRQAGRTWKVVHFSNTLYPPSPTAGRAGEDRARRGETKSCVRRATSGAWTRQAEGLLSDKPHQPRHNMCCPCTIHLPVRRPSGHLARRCKPINGGYIRQVFVQHGHLREMSSCSRAATRKQHTTFLNKYTSGWQWRSQGNLTQLQRRMHFPAECDMQVHRPGIFPSVPTRHVLDDGRLSHMQQT